MLPVILIGDGRYKNLLKLTWFLIFNPLSSIKTCTLFVGSV